jgi:hypothetical protein
MALHPVDDDEQLFTRAMTSYREAFLVRHAHLPESQRHDLWRQQITRFIPAIENNSAPPQVLPLTGGPSGISGKRTRQDATPRTVPAADAAAASSTGFGSGSGSGSGPPQAKRRATVCVTLVTLLPPFPSSSSSSLLCPTPPSLD